MGAVGRVVVGDDEAVGRHDDDRVIAADQRIALHDHVRLRARADPGHALLELDELEATRLYALASYITEDNKDEIERAWRIRLDDIDMTICNALGAAGFQYDEGKIS